MWPPLRAAISTWLLLFPLLHEVSAAETPSSFSEQETRKILQHSPLPPPPADPSNQQADSAAAARLGQSLFFDTALSAKGDVSCASCHDPKQGWSNGERVVDIGGMFPRHVPTLWNVAYNRWFFWDGRADSAWAQALAPLENPKEHAGNRMQAVRHVQRTPRLRRIYEAAFGPLPDLGDRSRFPPDARPVPKEPDHPHQIAWQAMQEADRETINDIFSNLGKSLAAYERRILSRNSPFDRFVATLTEPSPRTPFTISPAAQRGLKLFVGPGRCSLCHNGPNFTDGEFHNLGLNLTPSGRSDAGRYAGIAPLLADPFNRLGRYSDESSPRKSALITYVFRETDQLGQFKTPTLRNIAQTPPYMHDGRFATLEEVVRFYSERKDAVAVGHGDAFLEPLQLNDSQVADLVAFLRTLDGAPLDPALLTALSGTDLPPGPTRP